MPNTPRSIEVRRLTARTACVLTAFAFNAGALVIADSASGTATPALLPASSRATTALLLVAPMAPAAVASNRPTTAAPVKAIDAGARTTPGTVTQRASGLPARLADATTASQAKAELRFFRLGEVDEPAEPASDWNVEVATLDQLGIDHVIFEVLVSDRGEIINCVLALPIDLRPEVRLGLEERLRETEMRPAVKDGTRVASYRRIELYVDASNTLEGT